MFVPPLNLGGFQPSPATLAQWVYQIWQYLQENPIATQEQLQEYIGNFIKTSPETQTMIGEGVEQYLTDNPPTAPVQSVQGKTGAVQLAYNEIVPASNAVPVYKASSTPNTNTLVGQYNLGYRLFVNTATQEIFTISPAGALSLVGRGKFDGTTVDLNSAQGDTTIAEKISELESADGTIAEKISELESADETIAQNINSQIQLMKNESLKLARCQIKNLTTIPANSSIDLEFDISNLPTGYVIDGVFHGYGGSTAVILINAFSLSSQTPKVTLRNVLGSSVTMSSYCYVYVLYHIGE